MAKTSYPAVIEKGATGFGVYFPDLPGCVSAGESIAEAVQNGHEALALHVAGILEDGEKLPSPTPIEAIPPPHQDVIVAAMLIIGVNLPEFPQMVQVSIDASLLREIDALGKDRSRFLDQAARAELARRSAG